jgi:hypothetical protein
LNQVSPILRRGSQRYFHWCPACESLHPLPDHGWTFNGDVHRPSFSPSFKQGGLRMVIVNGCWNGEYHRGADGKPLDGTCHYFITDGLIQFCGDSWHGRSDIVAMPVIPQELRDFPTEEASDG